jgi:hypothetical protein
MISRITHAHEAATDFFQAQGCHPPSQDLVSLLLVPPSIELFLVPDRVPQMGVDIVVVKPGAVARLPLQAAHHAELSCASARHVVASFLQLHH